jgi:ABC-type amino acid transport substrate-binding protein
MGLVKNHINLKEFVYQKNIDTALSKKEKQYLKNHKIIRMCNNPNWEPIEFVQNGVPKGIAIDTLHILENKLNIKFEHISTKNWVQSQKYLKEGKCDILPAAIKTSKRLEYANFTDPYLDYKLAIITKNNQPLVNSIDNIIDKPISRKRGSGLITRLKNEYPNVKIVETDGYLESLHQVANDKAYSTIATLPVASYYINKFSLNNLYVAGYTKMRYKLSIAVRKNDHILLSILNKSLKTITKKQSKQIYNKWSNVTIKQSGFNSEIVLNILVIILVIIIFIVYRQYLLRKNNKQLKVMVDEKTKELQEINKTLELKIDKAVDEIRKKDKILYDQAKMASMGEMIGNIAHQWRQPLSVISTVASGNLVKIEYDMFDIETLKKDLKSIMQSTEYLSSTIDDFKNFLNPNENLINLTFAPNIYKKYL